MSDAGFSRGRQAGKPDDKTSMPVLIFSSFTGYCDRVPAYIFIDQLIHFPAPYCCLIECASLFISIPHNQGNLYLPGSYFPFTRDHQYKASNSKWIAPSLIAQSLYQRLEMCLIVFPGFRAPFVHLLSNLNCTRCLNESLRLMEVKASTLPFQSTKPQEFAGFFLLIFG